MRVHHTRRGTGEPIVLLHGSGASLHIFDRVADRLASRLEVVGLDLPGFGLTGPRPDRAVRAGDRAPDASYFDAGGGGRRVFDALRGPHFTLLAVGDAAIAEHVWPERGAPLRTVAIQVGSLPRVYGLDGPAQVLVRPDGYIAHVVTSDYKAALASSARTMAPPARAAPHPANASIPW